MYKYAVFLKQPDTNKIMEASSYFIKSLLARSDNVRCFQTYKNFVKLNLLEYPDLRTEAETLLESLKAKGVNIYERPWDTLRNLLNKRKYNRPVVINNL